MFLDWFRRKSITIGEFLLPQRLRVGGGSGANVTSPYTQSAWVYAGVRGKARAISGAPMVVKSGNYDSREGEPVPSTHALARLLSRPSPMKSMTETNEATSIHLDLDGEMFLLMMGTSGFWKPSPTPPAELLIVQPCYVKLHEEDIDSTSGLVKFWTVTLQRGAERKQIKIPAESMIQFALYNPQSPYRGLSPLVAAAQGIAIEYKADAYNVALLDNDCQPGGVLKSEEGLTDEEAKALKKMWKDAHRGARKAGEPAVLGKGLSWEPVAVTPRDMAMPTLREWSKDQIQAVLGVTDFEMGTIGEHNRASAVAARAWLWENTLLPMTRFIEEVFWFRLCRHLSTAGRDYWVEFDTSDSAVAQADMDAKVTQGSGLLDMGYTLNQVNERLSLGMPDVTWGNTPGGAGGGSDGEGLQIGDDGATPGIALPGASSPGGVAVRGASPAGLVNGLSKRSRAKALRLWHDKATEILERSLRKFYRTVQAEIVRKALPPLTAAMVEEILGAPARWQEAANAILGSTMERIGASALRNTRRILGGFEVVEIDDPRWLLSATRRTAQLIRVMLRYRTRIRDRILSAIASGDTSVTTLGELIEREFGSVIESSGLTIARTETAMVGSQIRDQVFRAEGIDATEWSAAMDAHTRESHAATDGEVRKLGERFSNGLLYPSEPGGDPAEIINCRCLALPRVG